MPLANAVSFLYSAHTIFMGCDHLTGRCGISCYLERRELFLAQSICIDGWLALPTERGEYTLQLLPTMERERIHA